MTLEEIKNKLRSYDIEQCEHFLLENFREIRPLFYGRTQSELYKLRFDFQDIFTGFIMSPCGQSIKKNKNNSNLPPSITALVVLFVSIFERCNSSSYLQNICFYLPDNSLNKQIQAIFEFKYITNAEANYIDRFENITELLNNAYREAETKVEKECCKKIILEYFLKALIETNKIGVNIKNKLKTLFENKINLADTLIMSVEQDLKEIFDTDFSIKEKKLESVRMGVTRLLHDKACELCPALLDSDNNSSSEKFQDQKFCALFPYLDNLLFDMGAIYRQNYEEVKINIKATEQRNRQYLGTYFPRTVIESWNIFHELLENPEVKKSFFEKKQIKILDIGSGTGGAVAGLTLALKSVGWGSKDSEIFINSVDANVNALGKQKEIIKSLSSQVSFKIYHNCREHYFPSQLDSFVQEFGSFAQQLDNYDLIIFWKCLCEFYNQGYTTALGIIKHAVSLVADHLTEEGLCILSDITSKIAEIEYFPEILNRELEEYCCSSAQALKTIIPIPCSFGKCIKACYTQRIFKVEHKLSSHDISKLSYRVLAPSSFANKITSKYLSKPYSMNAAKPYLSCLNGEISKSSQENIACGFTQFK
jgi:hypothetical protein